MKLTKENATFVGSYTEEGEEKTVSFREQVLVAEAQGILFECPKCAGSHQVLCWFSNPRNAPVVPATAFPRPGRWTFSGDTVETLTLTPSVDLSLVDADHPASDQRCYGHGFVTNGEAV